MEKRINERNDHFVIRRTLAYSAIALLFFGILEISLSFLPGGSSQEGAVSAQFILGLYQDNLFMGMRYLGLVNIIMVSVNLLFYYCICKLLRENSKFLADFAFILLVVGTAVFFANNGSFSLLSLSKLYDAADHELKMQLEGAVRAITAAGESHTPGTLPGMIYIYLSAIIFAIALIRQRYFPVYFGLILLFMNLLLLCYDVFHSFYPSLAEISNFLISLAGLLSILFYVMVAFRILRTERE
ncbi:MAG: DUF4386 family protein [Ignavibacteriales bacterium]|nr:DUF4386 family protein [Ignavibacteriales bacterium]